MTLTLQASFCRPLTVRTSNAAAEMAQMIAEGKGPPPKSPRRSAAAGDGHATHGGTLSSHSSMLTSPPSPGRLRSPSLSNASPRVHVICRICEERVPPAMLERHSQVR